MKFVLIVNAAPFSDQGALSAYHFCVAALNKGYAVKQVFFYGDGCMQQLEPNTSHAQEINSYQAWLKLQQQYNLSLEYCHTAADNRGLPNTGILKTSSLSQLILAINQADRVLSFGG